jgi:hypothetical protein
MSAYCTFTLSNPDIFGLLYSFDALRQKKRVFRPKQSEMAKKPGTFHNKELRNFFSSPNMIKSRDSSVGIALSYWLHDRGSKFRFPAGAGNFSLHHRVQYGSAAHPASYPMDNRGSFLGGKAAGA